MKNIQSAMLIKKTKNELTMCSGITGLEVEARWKNEQFINWIELLIGGLWVDKEKKNLKKNVNGADIFKWLIYVFGEWEQLLSALKKDNIKW